MENAHARERVRALKEASGPSHLGACGDEAPLIEPPRTDSQVWASPNNLLMKQAIRVTPQHPEV